jgi:hypothetical protein
MDFSEAIIPSSVIGVEQLPTGPNNGPRNLL